MSPFRRRRKGRPRATLPFVARLGESPESATQQAHALTEFWKANGPRGYWTKLLEFSRLPENPPETYRQLHQVAIIYARLGEREEAISSLEKAFDAHEIGLTELVIEPAFDPLHSDPRFQTLVRLAGLPAPDR